MKKGCFLLGDYNIRWSNEDITLITIRNLPNSVHALAKVFREIGDAGINVDMISQTTPYKNKINVFFTIESNQIAQMLTASANIKKIYSDIMLELSGDNCKFVLHSDLFKTTPGIACKLFGLLSENELVSKLITTSETEIEILFSNSDFNAVREVLMENFK